MKIYELKLLSEFLEQLSDLLGDNGCNDFVWSKDAPLSPEEIEDAKKDYHAFMCAEDPDYEKNYPESQDVVIDWMVVGMLKARVDSSIQLFHKMQVAFQNDLRYNPLLASDHDPEKQF